MKTRLALLLPDLRTGGAQKIFLSLAGEFARQGFAVDIITASPDGQLADDVPDGVRHIILTKRLPNGRFWLAANSTIHLLRYLRKFKPQALLSTLTGTNILAGTAHRLSNSGARLILREGATLANLRYPTYRPAMRCIYKRAHAIVALTSPMRDELIELLGCPPDQVVCIPNHVDLDRLRILAAQPLPEDFDASRPYLLAVGRLTPQKDYSTLICALAALTKRPSPQLVVLGEGPELGKLRELAAANALSKRIHFRGYEHNPYRWMAHASALVLSSRWEGHPNTVLEARALGVPVAMTEYDASARSVAGGNGHLAPVGDPVALAYAVESAITAKAGFYETIASPSESARAYLELISASELKSNH